MPTFHNTIHEPIPNSYMELKFHHHSIDSTAGLWHTPPVQQSKAKLHSDLIWKDKVLGPIERGHQKGRQATKRMGYQVTPPSVFFAVQGKKAFNLSTEGPKLAAFVVHALVPSLLGPDQLSLSIRIFYADASVWESWRYYRSWSSKNIYIFH